MVLARFGRQAKRPYGLYVKMTAVAVLGLCFIFVWSIFSSPSSSLTTQRESFDDIGEPTSSSTEKVSSSRTQSDEKQPVKHETRKEDKKVKVESGSEVKGEKKVNGSMNISGNEHESIKRNQKEMSSAKKGKSRPKSSDGRTKENGHVGQESEDQDSKEEEVQEVVDGKEEEANAETEANGVVEGYGDLDGEPDDEDLVKVQDKSNEPKTAGKKRKIKGPLFDPKMHYTWKLCSTRSKHNYIPCIDNEGVMGRLQAYRHTERSCPRTPPMCLVPLPHDGYETPVPWPESKSKVGVSPVLFFQLAYGIRKVRVA